MKAIQIQKQRESRIDAKLDRIAALLESVIKEIRQNESVKISKKTKAAIEKGLRELKAGRYTEYKTFEEFKKALG